MRFICAGYRVDSKKLVVSFFLEDAATLAPGGDVMIFPIIKTGAMKRITVRPGNIYEVEAKDPEKPTLFTFKAFYPVALYKGPEMLEWGMRHTDALAWRDIQKDMADPLKTALAPVRVIYQRMPAASRAQLLAKIVHYLS